MNKLTKYSLAGLLVAGAIACGAPGEEDDDFAAPVSANESAQAAPPANRAKIGQAVKDGMFQFTVKTVKCDVDKVGGGWTIPQRAQGDYCLVDLTVKNVGDEPRMFVDSNQFGFIGETKYASSSEASLAHAGDKPTWMTDINPGNQISATVVFDVPSDKKLTSIQLHDSAFSGGVTVTLS